jgi:hypothetical protein
MAQASGILSSAVHAVEGVPLVIDSSHHGDSTKIETGARQEHPMPLGSSNVAHVVSLVVHNAPAGVSRGDLGAPAPLSRLRKGYVLQFQNNLFLNGYRANGVWATATLSSAKVFWTPPTSAADLFCARILVVLVSNGGGLRRTILDVPREASTGDYRRDYGVAKSASALKEASDDDERREEQSATDSQGQEAKSNEASCHKASNDDGNDSGVRKCANNGDGVPPSFLIRTFLNTQRAQLEDGKKLVFAFIEAYLRIDLFGLQSGFGVRPDSLLFIGPRGNTLALPVSILLEPCDLAREIVQTKIRESTNAFGKGQR